MFNPSEHMMKLKGKDYLQVAWRLVWFRDTENGCGSSWGIKTELLEHGENWAVFRATITNEKGEVISTGHGSESAKDFGDYLEKAETKAVGRALAMLGFGTQFAADELDEGERIVDSPIDREPKNGGGSFMTNGKEVSFTPTCADCGAEITDKVHDWSVKKYKRPLCYSCQKKVDANGS